MQVTHRAMITRQYNARVITWAWSQSIDNPAHKYVLVCMATSCAHDNPDCVSGVGGIALLCGYDQEIVRQCITALVDQGYVTEIAGAFTESPLAVVWRLNYHMTKLERLTRHEDSVDVVGANKKALL